MQTTTIRDQSCPNADCKFYGKNLCGNVVMHGKLPPRFLCKECKRTWVAYRNTVFFGLHSPASEIADALNLLKNGMSIRKTAQTLQLSPGTIQRWKFRLKTSLLFN